MHAARIYPEWATYCSAASLKDEALADIACKLAYTQIWLNYCICILTNNFPSSHLCFMHAPRDQHLLLSTRPMVYARVEASVIGRDKSVMHTQDHWLHCPPHAAALYTDISPYSKLKVNQHCTDVHSLVSYDVQLYASIWLRKNSNTLVGVFNNWNPSFKFIFSSLSIAPKYWLQLIGILLSTVRELSFVRTRESRFYPWVGDWLSVFWTLWKEGVFLIIRQQLLRKVAIGDREEGLR